MFSTWKAVASSGRRRDHDVALLLEDPVHPGDRLSRLARRLDGEDVVVLVLEVARLVRPEPGEGVGDRRGLEADGRDLGEIDGVGHGFEPTVDEPAEQRRQPGSSRSPGRTRPVS